MRGSGLTEVPDTRAPAAEREVLMRAHHGTTVVRSCVATLLLILVSDGHRGAAAQTLFESRQITPGGEYTAGIEGPAVDASGILYVVNFQRQGMIGQLRPGAERSELFARLPAGSIGNGIRFDKAGRMYVADFKKHNVLVFEPGQRTARVYFHSDRFNQPNDLAIAADGTLYASDPNFRARSGQIWRITRQADGQARGEIMESERRMGTTNGIDVSPSGDTLFVSESNTRELRAYKIEGTKLVSPRLVRKFSEGELDGLRTDVDGTIFVTRPPTGIVAMVSPDGTLVREIRTRGKQPSNLTFGGPDGRTVFVTQVDGRFIEAFRVDRPGRETCREAAGKPC
jgi:signal peptidase